MTKCTWLHYSYDSSVEQLTLYIRGTKYVAYGVSAYLVRKFKAHYRYNKGKALVWIKKHFKVERGEPK